MTNWLMTWTVGGAEGIPIPYSPRMDDGITIVCYAVSFCRPMFFPVVVGFYCS